MQRFEALIASPKGREPAAEGLERDTGTELHRHLSTAMPFRGETRPHLSLACDIGYLTHVEFVPRLSDAEEVRRIIGGLGEAVGEHRGSRRPNTWLPPPPSRLGPHRACHIGGARAWTSTSWRGNGPRWSDVFVVMGGNLSATGRAIVIGQASPQQGEIWARMQETLAALHGTVPPGARTGDLRRVLLKTSTKYRMAPAMRFLGHGLGLSPHEEPFLAGHTGAPVEARMVFAVEPV